MYISFLFFCHLCLLYFTVRVEQSAIHGRGCCFCHPSTFQNPGPQSAKWIHPKSSYSINLQWKFTPAFQQSQWIQWISESNFTQHGLSSFSFAFWTIRITQAFAGPIWAASLSLVKKTNPHAHRIVLIFSFSFSLMKFMRPSRIRMNIWSDLIQFASSHHHLCHNLIQRFHRKSRHHWPSHDGFTSTAAKVCIHRHKDTTWLTSNVAQHGAALEVFQSSTETTRRGLVPCQHHRRNDLPGTKKSEKKNKKHRDLNSQTSQTSNYVVNTDENHARLSMWSAKRTPDIQAASIVDARSGIELSQSPPKTKKIQSCQSWTLDVACDTIRCAADQTKSTPSLLAQPGCVIWYCWWSWYQLDSGCHKQDLSRILDENSI